MTQERSEVSAHESSEFALRESSRVSWYRWLVRLPGGLLILLARAYQWGISPWLGPRCRFNPSCSNYFIAAVQKYGALRGTIRGVARICRCHPFHPGGYDPP